ncbi:hypothetical protein [Aliagarivorans taiwanensis]|uniref:hypothetical protein n=1 Tax=Aliagarivorans taiwanensis TaxID=561966 RepID=UPI0012FC3DAB|nr:hypothetical protein [Aliagarivorans taiwanensis]
MPTIWLSPSWRLLKSLWGARAVVALFAGLLFPAINAQASDCQLNQIPANQQYYGCACSFYLPTVAGNPTRILLQTQLDGSDPILNRDGRAQPIWGSRSTEMLSEAGQQQLHRWRWHNQAINLKVVAAPRCEWGKAGCEVVHYVAQLAIAGNYQQCEWLLQGDCGC